MNFENGQLEKGAVQPKVMFDCTTRGRPAVQHCAARSIDRRRRVEGVGEGEGGAPKKMKSELASFLSARRGGGGARSQGADEPDRQ